MVLDILPTLRLRGGRIMARDAQGREVADPTRPSEWAGDVARAGARWAHIEDLDARDGKPAQWTAIPAIQSQGLRIQYGGGIRRMVQVQQLLELGVDRVVVGRQAQAEPRWAEELVKLYPGRIVLCLGGSDDDVATLERRAMQANAWHVAGLIVPNLPEASLEPLVTRLHASAPSPALQVHADAGTERLSALQDAGARAILLGNAATGDLSGIVRAFPQRAMPPPIQVLRARGDDEGDDEA